MSKKFAIYASLIFAIILIATVFMKISIRNNNQGGGYGYVEAIETNIFKKQYDYMNGTQSFYFFINEDVENFLVNLEIGAEEGKVLVDIYDDNDMLVYTLESNDDGTSKIESVSIPTNSNYRYKTVVNIDKTKNATIDMEWNPEV